MLPWFRCISRGHVCDHAGFAWLGLSKSGWLKPTFFTNFLVACWTWWFPIAVLNFFVHQRVASVKKPAQVRNLNRPKRQPDIQQRAGLVGGLEHFLFSHILGIIIPIDFHIFQRGSNHQPAGECLWVHSEDAHKKMYVSFKKSSVSPEWASGIGFVWVYGAHKMVICMGNMMIHHGIFGSPSFKELKIARNLSIYCSGQPYLSTGGGASRMKEKNGSGKVIENRNRHLCRQLEQVQLIRIGWWEASSEFPSQGQLRFPLTSIPRRSFCRLHNMHGFTA